MRCEVSDEVVMITVNNQHYIIKKKKISIKSVYIHKLESLEDIFTQVYVYDLKEIHHYDHHNTFWDRSRHLQNNNSRCLKQFYDSLNDEYQKSYSGQVLVKTIEEIPTRNIGTQKCQGRTVLPRPTGPLQLW